MASLLNALQFLTSKLHLLRHPFGSATKLITIDLMTQLNDTCETTPSKISDGDLASPKFTPNLMDRMLSISKTTTSITKMVEMHMDHELEMLNATTDMTSSLHSDIDNESKLDVDDWSFSVLLSNLCAVSEDTILAEHGYKKISKICDTVQGVLYKAEKLNDTNINNKYVAIKRCERILRDKQEAIQDGMNFIVSEDIIKEAIILKHLTVDNQPIGEYIVKYIDSFQSDEYYYLVMEYIESDINLAQFVQNAFKHIHSNKLRR